MNLWIQHKRKTKTLSKLHILIEGEEKTIERDDFGLKISLNYLTHERIKDEGEETSGWRLDMMWVAARYLI